MLQFEDYAGRLISGAKSRAKRSGVRCTLNKDNVRPIWERAGGRCEVSRLSFSDEEFPDVLVKHPFAPSFDRIIPGGDYSLENVWLVCVCTNFAMGEWGLDTLIKLADSLLNSQQRGALRRSLISLWRARLEGQIVEALRAIDHMSADEARAYQKRIVGLRATLTKSHEGLRAAAAKARTSLEAKQAPA
jgi:hypothetical protein